VRRALRALCAALCAALLHAASLCDVVVCMLTLDLPAVRTMPEHRLLHLLGSPVGLDTLCSKRAGCLAALYCNDVT
jgi:hypothetical protein